MGKRMRQIKVVESATHWDIFVQASDGRWKRDRAKKKKVADRPRWPWEPQFGATFAEEEY